MTARNYLDRIEAAYQGEVYGEAMYLAIAAARPDPDHAWKWRVLAQQEIETKDAMRVLVAAHGGETRELDASSEAGLAAAGAYAPLPWPELMRRFSDALDDDIAEYSDLEKDCPPADAATLKRLTLHELLTKEFCELELAGRGDKSLRAILASLEHPPPR
ncbi:MAG: hypothetical protein OEW35_04785 [Gammaproteobacteria bacterium]|nr:hypothetical protein [Gammaproteobacteria bacterium]MDH4256359.1 hypothetical protein [Gammaproteobacteria bacterium]MDH5309115.1 hypothetical protein [Gammaproteobacteria bacterium]